MPQWQTVQLHEHPTEISKCVKYLPLNLEWSACTEDFFANGYSLSYIKGCDFVLFRCNISVWRQHKVSGGIWRMSLGDACLYYPHPIVILLLFYRYTLCLISSHLCHTLWIHQISEDMRHPGRRFHHRVKLPTVGYTAWNVNGSLSPMCKKDSPTIRVCLHVCIW